MRVGQSSLQSSQFFVNAAYPLTDKLELYALGGTATELVKLLDFTEENQSRSYTGLYPNGFT
jgi:iron complex outermembrane receptor protein